MCGQEPPIKTDNGPRRQPVLRPGRLPGPVLGALALRRSRCCPHPARYGRGEEEGEEGGEGAQQQQLQQAQHAHGGVLCERSSVE